MTKIYTFTEDERKELLQLLSAIQNSIDWDSELSGATIQDNAVQRAYELLQCVKDRKNTQRIDALDEAIEECQETYVWHYKMSMRDHIEGYDDDDLKEVKQRHWIRACGASECASKIEQLKEK